METFGYIKIGLFPCQTLLDKSLLFDFNDFFTQNGMFKISKLD